jgi:hypothetical protein
MQDSVSNRTHLLLSRLYRRAKKKIEKELPGKKKVGQCRLASA